MENKTESLKAKDLRIGNLVKVGHLTGSIESFIRDRVDIRCSENLVIHEMISALSGIPLTSEWLLKAGFEKKGPYKWDNDCMPNYLMTYPSGFIMEPIAYEIKYVHQLQNIYHAIAGEELIFKNMIDGK